MSIYILFKANIACLLTHQLMWSFAGQNKGRDSYYCEICKKYFYYPSRADQEPIYK